MGLATIVECEKWIPERYREGQGRGVTSVQGKMIDHDGTVHSVESLKMISREAKQSLVYDEEPRAIYDVKSTIGRKKSFYRCAGLAKSVACGCRRCVGSSPPPLSSSHTSS